MKHRSTVKKDSPDGTRGVRLHFITDDNIPHVMRIDMVRWCTRHCPPLK